MKDGETGEKRGRKTVGGRRAGSFTAVTFVAGVALIAYGGWSTHRASALRESGVRGLARVESTEPGGLVRGHRQNVRFADETGIARTATVESGRDPIPVGSTVPILYLKSDPGGTAVLSAAFGTMAEHGRLALYSGAVFVAMALIRFFRDRLTRGGNKAGIEKEDRGSQ